MLVGGYPGNTAVEMVTVPGGPINMSIALRNPINGYGAMVDGKAVNVNFYNEDEAHYLDLDANAWLTMPYGADLTDR